MSIFKQCWNTLRGIFRQGYIILGPVRLLLWRGAYLSGPELVIGGLSLLSRASDGSLILASYHPRRSLTWWWSISATHRQHQIWKIRRGWRSITPPGLRRGQWHDYYRLPFGWSLGVARQDYHRRSVEQQTKPAHYLKPRYGMDEKPEGWNDAVKGHFYRGPERRERTSAFSEAFSERAKLPPPPWPERDRMHVDLATDAGLQANAPRRIKDGLNEAVRHARGEPVGREHHVHVRKD